MCSFPPLFDLPSVGHDPKSTESWPITTSIPPTSTNINGVDVLWSNNTSTILS
jgi:predicted lipoprotein